MIRTRPDDPHRLDDLQTAGFIWFVMLITSVYVGAASALADELLDSGRGSVTDRAAVALEVEAAVGQLEGVARAVQDGLSGDEAVAAVLVARYSVQGTLASGRTGCRAARRHVVHALLRHRLPVRGTAPVGLPPAVPVQRGRPLLDYFAGNPLQLA